jgi:hypothetical protein
MTKLATGPVETSKLHHTTDQVPQGRNKQEPGTEVPGTDTNQDESRQGRHRRASLQISSFVFGCLKRHGFRVQESPDVGVCRPCRDSSSSLSDSRHFLAGLQIVTSLRDLVRLHYYSGRSV